MIELIRPLFDARLWLSALIVICATVLAWHGKIDGYAWGAAIAACVWWAGGGSIDGIGSRISGTKSTERGLR